MLTILLSCAGVALAYVVISSDGVGDDGAERPESTSSAPAPQGQEATVAVTDHGAVGDGVTDDTEAFLRATRAADGAGAALSVAAGVYILSAQVELPDGVTTVLLDDDAVLRQTADAPVFVRRGEVRGDPIDATGADLDASSIGIADASPVGPGDWIVVASTRVVHESKGFRLGSLRQVTAADGDSIELDRPLTRDLRDGTTIWPISLAPPIEVRGGTLEHGDPQSSRAPLVLFEWVDAPSLDAVELRECGGSGVKVVGTVGGSLSVFVHDCLDDQSGERYGGDPHYGYGVEVTGPTRDLEVSGRSHTVRHAFTTNGSFPMEDERLQNVGEPERIDVSMEVWETTSSGLDTHELGTDIRFHDCSVRDAGTYALDGSDDGKEGGFGIFIRAQGTTVERCEIDRASVSGIVVAEPATGFDPWDPEDAPRIVETTIRDTLGRSAVQIKQPTMLELVSIAGSHRFGVQFEDTAGDSSVENSTITLSADEDTFAFVKPGRASLTDNDLTTDERILD